MKKLVLLLVALCSTTAQAQVVTSQQTKMVFINSYTQYGNGDVIFSVENVPSVCAAGFWLTKADIGFQANMALLISAHLAKSTVVISAHADETWAGSNGKYCKLYSVEVR